MSNSSAQTPEVRIISVFNNKGGVGKTTLSFHLAHALAELGHRVLLVDLDPQCNLTLYCMDVEEIHSVWQGEDGFFESFQEQVARLTPRALEEVLSTPRTVHFMLRPTEEGTGELPRLPVPRIVAPNLDLLPGRLTLHSYEDKIASRWSEAYQGDPLAIRTLTRPRQLIREFAQQRGYTVAIVDTSPSLGVLNKVAISTVDGFIVPCMPDMFSLYGIRNIGDALGKWKKQFDTMYSLISEQKRAQFPAEFVKFLGFTLYNARRYAGQNEWDLATANMNYARQIPEAIRRYIPAEVRRDLSDADIEQPIGATAVMHTHNTLTAMAQKYRLPMWSLPSSSALQNGDRNTVGGSRKTYENTREAYHTFAQSVMGRIEHSLSRRPK
jgi:cellulose biosynthesis protein BcsQ